MNEFSRQVERLIELDYPALLGMDAAMLRAILEPLRRFAPIDPSPAADAATGLARFVIVLTADMTPISAMLDRIVRAGKSAIERLYPKTPADFRPIDTLALPGGHAYLALDIDRGAALLNVTPDAALEAIAMQRRSPLTIEEGIALLTHYPEFLQPNNCFSLLASRCGDRRVPAFWLSQGRPKLGWCWAGNPHTWLGSASCASRAGAVVFDQVHS